MRLLALRAVCAASLVVAALGACSSSTPGPITLTLWSHGGTDHERAALQASLAAFHSVHPTISVTVHTVTEGDYTAQLQAAVSEHNVPDVVDVDGPLVASFAAQGAFEQLDRLVSDPVRANTLETLRAQGTWNGHLWALGQFDSGLGIWADARALRAAGVRIPTGLDDAWTASEFADVLRRLARHDPDHRVLDLKLDYGAGEWMTYGFAPLVASAGGDITDTHSSQVLEVLEALGAWRAYVDPDADGKAFTARRVALSWVGHWEYPAYSRALGDDLVLLPLPDLGYGSKTGSGSWAWAVSSKTERPKAAGLLLSWFQTDAEVLRMTAANGALPGTYSALAKSPIDAPGGALHLYAAMREAGAAVPRPVTPDYPTLTAAFGGAVYKVLTGTAPSAAIRAPGS